MLGFSQLKPKSAYIKRINKLNMFSLKDVFLTIFTLEYFLKDFFKSQL